MSGDKLTPEELDLVHAYIDLAPGLQPDQEDVVRASIAQEAGGWFRKLAPGQYEIGSMP